MCDFFYEIYLYFLRKKYTSGVKLFYNTFTFFDYIYMHLISFFLQAGPTLGGANSSMELGLPKVWAS